MKFIDVHTHNMSTSNDVVFIKNYYPKDIILNENYYSIGIHPWYLDKNTLNYELSIIEKLLKDQNCLAVGECGLDRTVKSDFLLQRNVFTQQLKISEKLKKPVIVHCVKAYQDLIEIIKKEHITVPIIFHGFSKNQFIHSVCLKIPNLYFSFGKSLLTSKTTQANLLATPIERVFLESDDSSIDIKYLYLQAAIIKNISIESLQKQLFLNFQNVFKANLKRDNGEILVRTNRITD